MDNETRSETRLRQRIINRAEHYVGTTEIGGENSGPLVEQFLRATGVNQPAAWCASYLSYVMMESAPGIIQPNSVVMNIKEQYEQAGAFIGLPATQRLHPADLVFFRRGTEGWQGHVAFIKDIDYRNQEITIIEGNKPPIEYEGTPQEDSIPDTVREITIPISELAERGIIGFGDTIKMFRESGAPNPIMHRTSLPEPSPITPGTGMKI